MTDNILHFPDFTIVNRVVPKNSFYRHFEVSSRMKSLFVDNIEQIVWLYKLAPSNLHITDGKEVHEIAVFLVKQKQATDCQELLRFIDVQMPRHTLFILQQGESFRLLINYKRWKDSNVGTFDVVKSFATQWLTAQLLILRIDDAQSMDMLYESLVRQVASSQIFSSQQNLYQAVMETQEVEAIKKEMESVKKRETRERQPQKKFALHKEYLRLKELLDNL